MVNSFQTNTTLAVNERRYRIHSLRRLHTHIDIRPLPFSLRILLENLLRCEDGLAVTREDIMALAAWDPQAEPATEIAFTPSRVVLQDFTGVPVLADLAAMRDAMETLGGSPGKINPLSPVELVIDHSVQVDVFGQDGASSRNEAMEFARNGERYAFLRWGQSAFSNFTVVPPGQGIIHQINLEHLAWVVSIEAGSGGGQDHTPFDDPRQSTGLGEEDNRGIPPWAVPDTVVGTDSHTTMVNALGVLGWGVGGIEAEAAMLGQPISMLIPQVVGCRLTGQLPEGRTATDLVLTLVERLRAHGVVGKFVEFFGDGLDHLPLADRATLANMAPEYGATCGIFPIDDETLRYLSLSGRPPETIALVAAYAREQGLFRASGESMIHPDVRYSDTLQLDLGAVQPSLAGPKRPQDRIVLSEAKTAFRRALQAASTDENPRLAPEAHSATLIHEGGPHTLQDGVVAIAAITSCTNTSNPEVMMGAGLLAGNARDKGLAVKPWVKTSLAPGSRVVTEYLRAAGLLSPLEALGFHVVGYGCATCIGNSGPLPEAVADAIHHGDITACAVLSGNRNFEGRIHADVKMNFLASPPLVVAYALAGTLDIDMNNEPLGADPDGNPVFLRDIWPSRQAVLEAIATHVTTDLFTSGYRDAFTGDERWRAIATPATEQFPWDTSSTYIRRPPYFQGISRQPETLEPIRGARVLALLGDSVTTDHISPAGAIKSDSPAGLYLRARGVEPGDFNSYGSRRGNHEVMVRGTFANIRLRNRLLPGVEGGWSLHEPTGEQLPIYEVALRYRAEGTPLMVIAGKEYGSGSSRDWAAKGTRLLGVRAVLAESFERIHRANLIGMGVLPLQFPEGEGADSLALTGLETYDLDEPASGDRAIVITVTPPAGDPGPATKQFTARVRIDTPKEWEYYRHGGILPYVLRTLAG
uniref:Aconitate hydratase n=1 Tax=Candidatus Kentrum eta TaxID=2126337 RepID=A0A450U733_9GAMM|nr:MAG: aconitate hydratase [Candidatus Kentron sp. H]VFJ89087.1 MAG: aconitate hydratase [Candidatus Kentron sp. H]VFJ95775.1 MAG: aconitate hydratase [Candidatus Kentron sp. H]